MDLASLHPNRDAVAHLGPAPVVPGRTTSVGRLASRVERFFLQHPRFIPRVQVAMIAIYLVLIAVPPLLPPPAPDATPLTSFVLFSQFAIWAVWWPFVLLSLIPFGRAWCGVFCPEGALAQRASRLARQRRVPRWLTWGGTPLLAFITITAIGQLVEVDERPLPQLLVLGGSTVLAVVVSIAFTRDARVWCRYLCPVAMLFGVFSRLGAAVFHVDRERLERVPEQPEPGKGKCPVLIHLPAMATARDCLMCFRCSGWRDAIHLRFRRPGEELEHIRRAEPSLWEVLFLFAGAIGLPLGVFVAEKFELGGGLLLASLLAGAVLAAGTLMLLTALAARIVGKASGDADPSASVHLGYAYAPLGLFSLFLGLSQPTFEVAMNAGLAGLAAVALRLAFLAAGAAWSVLVAYRLLRQNAVHGRGLATALVPCLSGIALVVSAWAYVLL